MRFSTIMLIVISMLFTACGGYSKNMLASNLRSAGDAGVIALLDYTPEENYDATKGVLRQLVTDLRKFMQDGQVSDLPVEEAKEKLIAFLKEKGYDKELVIKIVDWIFNWLDEQDVPIDKLDQYTVYCINQVLTQMDVAINQSRKEWRPKKE